MKIKIKTIILFVLITIIFQYTFKFLIKIDILDKIVSQLDDISYIILFSIIILSSFLNKNQFNFKKTPVNFMIISIVMWALISLIINQSPIINFLLFFKNYFLVFAFYYFILLSTKISNKVIIQTLEFLISLFVIQIAFQIIQLLINLKNGTLNDDSLAGSFSGANNLGYTLFIPMFFMLTLYINKIKINLKKIVIFSISLIATFAEFAFVSLPFFFILYNFKKLFSFYNFKKILSVSSILVILFTTISMINPQRTSGTNSIFKVFSPEFLIYKITESEFDVYSGSARMLWFPITYNRLNDKTYCVNSYVGMGPGMYASFAAFKLMPYTNKSIYDIFGQLEKGMDANVDSQLIPIWGELGHIGLLLFILSYLIFAMHHYRNYKRSNDLLVKSLNITVSASSLYLILGMYVNHVLETQTLMGTYVFFMAIAEKLYRMEKNEKKAININSIN